MFPLAEVTINLLLHVLCVTVVLFFSSPLLWRRTRIWFTKNVPQIPLFLRFSEPPRGTFHSTSGLSFAQPCTGLSTSKETAPIMRSTHQPESSKSVKYFSPGTNCEMYLRLEFLLITSSICKPPAEVCHNVLSGIICVNLQCKMQGLHPAL